jgi:hypothetical protein
MAAELANISYRPYNSESTSNPGNTGQPTFQYKAPVCRHVVCHTPNPEISDLVCFLPILHVSVPDMNIWWPGCKARVESSARMLGRGEGLFVTFAFFTRC